MAKESQALVSQSITAGGPGGTAAAARSWSVATLWDIDLLQRRSALRAEQRLLFAVLEEAIGTFQRYIDSKDRRGRRLFGEVEEWFGSDDTTRTFAFVSLCDELGLDSVYVRSGLVAGRMRGGPGGGARTAEPGGGTSRQKGRRLSRPCQGMWCRGTDDEQAARSV